MFLRVSRRAIDMLCGESRLQICLQITVRTAGLGHPSHRRQGRGHQRRAASCRCSADNRENKGTAGDLPASGYTQTEEPLALLDTETAAADWRDDIFAALKAADIRQVGYVPDAGHSRLIPWAPVPSVPCP